MVARDPLPDLYRGVRDASKILILSERKKKLSIFAQSRLWPPTTPPAPHTYSSPLLLAAHCIIPGFYAGEGRY